MSDRHAFHEARERSIRGPRGPLALVNAEDVDAPGAVWPVQGEWAPAVGGLTLTASVEDGVVVDGVPLDGTVLVAGDDAIVPSVVEFRDGMAATVARTQRGHGVRVWDPTSEALSRFARIGAFPDDPAWVVEASFSSSTDDDNGAAAPVVTDAAGAPLPVAGRITFRHGDTDVDLIAVQAGRQLQVIFQDATNGDTTYSMGRFLFVDVPTADGPVELDFNRAVLPPCAFSWQYACPIPPPQNRLPFAVTAGETHGFDVDGAPLH